MSTVSLYVLSWAGTVYSVTSSIGEMPYSSAISLPSAWSELVTEVWSLRPQWPEPSPNCGRKALMTLPYRTIPGNP